MQVGSQATSDWLLLLLLSRGCWLTTASLADVPGAMETTKWFPSLFNPLAQRFTIEKFMIEKSGVEKFLLALGLKSSWLKSLGLKIS